MSILVDEVKAELSNAKLEPKCPGCGSKILFGVWTTTYRVNLEDGTSEAVSENGVFLDAYCECGWSISA